MKCVHKNGSPGTQSFSAHEQQLTDFGILGNLSVNISFSRIRELKSDVDYFWDSEAMSHKTITIQVDGIAQIIIGLAEVKTFKEGQLVQVKADRLGMEDNIEKSIIVIL